LLFLYSDVVNAIYWHYSILFFLSSERLFFATGWRTSQSGYYDRLTLRSLTDAVLIVFLLLVKEIDFIVSEQIKLVFYYLKFCKINQAFSYFLLLALAVLFVFIG